MRYYSTNVLLGSIVFAVVFALIVRSLTTGDPTVHLFVPVTFVLTALANWFATIGIKGSASPWQARHLQVSMPYDDALKSCVQSLKAIGRVSVKRNDSEAGIIEAETGWSWWGTCGQIISFRLGRIDDTCTSILLTNRPPMRTALLDFGKGYRNMESIIGFLSARAETQVLES